MAGRTIGEWEELARREPYFSVLTSDGTVGSPGGDSGSAAFFASGEADVALLLATLASLFGGPPPLTSVLDFGCGAGRLTLPLARRAAHVVACDIAPTMLLHARSNAAAAGLANIDYLLAGELTALPHARFDFICSLLVLQHVEPADGYALIGSLAAMLVPGGIAALQLVLAPPLRGLRRLARGATGRTAGSATGGAATNDYDARLVVRRLGAAGASLVARLATHGGGAHDGSARDTVLVIEKQAAGLQEG